MICIIFVLNQQEATGGNVIRMIYIKCTVLRVRRAECCGNVGERMNIHIVLAGKLEGMNGLGGIQTYIEDNIKIDIEGKKCLEVS